VDASENLYVTDLDPDSFFQTQEFLAAGGYTAVNTLYNEEISGNQGNLLGIAVDAAGDVFLAADSELTLLEIQRSHGPALSFASTNVGSTSSPQSILFQNIGNAQLSGDGVLTDSVDFTPVAGSGTHVDCTYDLSLAPGAECNLSLSFTPQSAGPLTSTLTLSDNALNGKPTKQMLQLSGTGIGPWPSVRTTTSLPSPPARGRSRRSR